MARNKGGESLDLATRNHLSALDAFIKAEVEASKPIQLDEFTVGDYVARLAAQGVTVAEAATYKKLMGLVSKGTLSVRKFNNGRVSNVFRFT